MTRYLKLVHMEIWRFRYMLIGLASILVLVQFGAYFSKKSSNEAQLRKFLADSILSSHLTSSETKVRFISVVQESQFWYDIPIALCLAVLCLYVFLIWYRDWTGRNTFIYRLLMLPTSRISVYLAKFTAILAFVFAFVALQVLVLLIQQLLFNATTPAELWKSSYLADTIAGNKALAILIPVQLDAFVFNYSLGILALIVIFAGILIERSVKRIGILLGILYVIGSGALIASPLLIVDNVKSWRTAIFPAELITLMCAIGLIVLFISLWISVRCINRRITV